LLFRVLKKNGYHYLSANWDGSVFAYVNHPTIAPVVKFQVGNIHRGISHLHTVWEKLARSETLSKTFIHEIPNLNIDRIENINIYKGE